MLDGPEQLQRLHTFGISPPTTTSSTAALTTPTSRIATFLTPLIKQVLVPNGRALASALFAVYGDIETSSTPSYSTATSSSCATAPPTPPLPTVRQPASAPPSPPSSTSPSSPPDTDSSQYTYIDLTNDDYDYDDNRGAQQALHDGSLQLGEHYQAHEDDDTEWAEEEQEQEESSEEAARRLEQERSVAEREWREGPLAAALREAALAPPTLSSRPRAPDLLYDMRRFEEREAFRDALRVNRRGRRTDRRDHSLPSTSTSTSTSSILDSIVADRLRRSPPPDLRQTARRRSQHSFSFSCDHHHQEEEEEPKEEPEAADDGEAEQDELSFPSSGRGGRTTFEHERLFWTSLAICESRKRVHDHNSADWLAAINKSRAELENEHSAFERAFVRLRLKEQRRRLKKARAKWLADDRRPFTLEEKALTSRVLRGRAAEVLVTGFNTELTRQDLQRLRDTEWLNDEVINFYLSLLKQRSDDRLKKADAQQAAAGEAWPRVHFLNTFFYPLLSDKGGYNYARVQKWTRRIDLFAMDRVVVPIHLGNHWCLAVINLQDRRFEYYDSLGSSNRECLQRLRRYLQDEARDKKKIELDLADWGDHQPKDIPLQKNGYDCGVFACKFAECIASGRPFYFSQVDMPIYRKRMMVSILTKTLT